MMKKNSKQNLNRLTKTKLQTRAAGSSNKLVAGAICALTLISFIAPYIPIFLDKTSEDEWFGFRNLRFFLYAFGLPLSLFACSSLLLFTLKYMNEFKLKLYLTIAAMLFNYTSIFHFVWIFWVKGPDFSEIQYHVSIVAISAIYTCVYILFYKHYQLSIHKLQNALNAISIFAFSGVKKHIKEDSFDDYAKDSIEVLKKGRG
jgi:hypothetical protein